MRAPFGFHRFVLCSLCLCGGALLASACSTQHAQTPPVTPPPPPLEYIGEWGTRGDGPGQLSGPTGIAVDSVGNIFISDGASQFVHKFNALGHPLQSFQDPFLKQPSGIALDLGDAIYVSDCRQNAVQIFLFSAERFRVLRGGAGRRLVCPGDLKVDAEGYTFVLDDAGRRVLEFDNRGRGIRAWGKQGSAPGEFGPAAGLAIGADGLIYVLDAGNRRVQKFSRDGAFVAQWEIPSPPGGAAEANGFGDIAVSRDAIYLVNTQRRTIGVWSLEGVPKLETNGAGHLQSESAGALHLALSPRNELLVLDTAGPRVLRFRINF